MALTIEQLNAIWMSEMDIPPNLAEDYSEIFLPTISNNWDNIKTSMTLGQILHCSEFSMRLAQLRPVGEINFWPGVVKQHPMLLHYVKSVVVNFFARRQRSVYINWSPAFLTMDTSGVCAFKYASRSNFGALQVSYLIHDYESLDHFINEILAEFDLQQYFHAAIDSLCEDYEGTILPLSLVWHLTQANGRIWGSRKGHAMNRGLTTERCCKNGWNSFKREDSNCIWRALSSLYNISSKGEVIRREGKPRVPCRPRDSIAKRLKLHFLRYFKYIASTEFGYPVTRNGYNEAFLHILEDFLKCNIVIYSSKTVKGKKLSRSGLKDSGNCLRLFHVEYNSRQQYMSTAHLLSNGTNHIRRIFDPKQLSSKYICKKCNQGFFEVTRLNQHMTADCGKTKYIAERMYLWNRSCEKLLDSEVDLKSKFEFDKSYGHALINQAENNGVSVRLHLQIDAENEVILEEKFSNLCEVGKYLLTSVPKTISPVLVERFQKNVIFLREFENKLNDMKQKVSSEKTFSTDGMKTLYKLMLTIKKEIVDHLSTYCIYIESGNEGAGNVKSDQVMFDILSELTSIDQLSCGYDVRYVKGKLSSVKKTGFPLQFISLNCLGLHNKANEACDEHVLSFKDTVDIYQKELNLNLVGKTSPSAVGISLLANCLSPRNAVSFYSPPLELYHEMESSVRFGLLSSKETVIHSDGEKKSGFSLDFSKFYARILMSDKLNVIHTGHGLKYQPNDKGIFCCLPNRKRQTMSNFVMILLEECMEGQNEIRSALFGVEEVWKFPTDGVIINGKKRSLVHFHGCLFHACDQICHQWNGSIDKTYPSHRKNCIVCINSEKKGVEKRFMPTLFKLKHDETNLSPHRIKKNQSYQQVYEETLKRQQEIEKTCNLEHVIIRECDLIRFYWDTVGSFFKHIGLQVKPKYEHVLFQKIYSDLVYEHFPLMKYRNLNLKTVLKAISESGINGYAVISANCGMISQKALGIVEPFCYKDESGQSKSSFSVEKKLVPIVLVQELLNNRALVDFCVTEIFTIFEFRKMKKNPFGTFKDCFIDSLEKHGKNKDFTSSLKLALNSAVGVMAFHPKNKVNSYVVKNNELEKVLHMKNYSHGTRLNCDYSIIHVRDKRFVKNLSHLHLNVINAGKRIMLQFLLHMRSFCNVEIIRVNTDGLVATSSKPQSLLNLKKTVLTSSIIDEYIDLPMSHVRAIEYIAFKKTYFEDLGFCLKHELSYCKFLEGNGMFEDQPCCSTFKNLSCEFPLNCEIIADKGIVIGKNKLALANTQNGKSMIKSAGLLDDRLCNVWNMNLTQLNQLLSVD